MSGSVRKESVYRSGWGIKPDALRRYLEEGHNINCGPHPPPIVPTPDVDGPSVHRSAKEKRKEKQKKELRFWNARQENELEFARVCQVSRLRYLRKRAPREVKNRLVLPHAIVHSSPHAVLGEYLHRNLVIATGCRQAGHRKCGPGAIDLERIQTYIDAANSLIADDKLRATVGFTMSDFKFLNIPEEALQMPLFTNEEVKELLADPALMQLYATSSRKLLSPYVCI